MNNVNNFLMSKKDLEDFVNKYVNIYNPNAFISINDINKLRQTLVHKSYCLINPEADDADNFCAINFSKNLKTSNERLEFLGDRVLELVIIEYLFDIFPDKDEGFLTSLKIKLVQKKNLAKIGKDIGLNNMILMSSMLERTGTRNNNIRLLEDTFESFIGGLFKDQMSNYHTCKAFILGIMKTHVNLEDFINTDDNYKTLVLKEFHKLKWSDPKYFLTKKSGDITGNAFNTTLCVLKKNVTEVTYFLQDLDNKNRELISNYGGDIVGNEYIILVANTNPFGVKKSAEQECCKIFMNTILHRL